MITFKSHPVAGQPFEFYVDREHPEVISHDIYVEIDHNIVHEFNIQCPDPPCHEMFYIEKEFAEKHLLILYSNNFNKEIKRFDFIIQT